MARKRRGSVRTGSGKIVERIVENARYLKDHPDHATPTCQGGCTFLCTFRRARRRVSKVHKHAEDDEKLKKLAKRFHPLGKAYAAVLRVANAGTGKLEYLQNVSTPKGKLPVAPWTGAPAPCHVGMQHRHDPQLRLMAALPFVSDDDVVFATDDGLVCAHDGEPPEETWRAMVQDLGLTPTDQGACCPHVPEVVGSRPVILVTWHDAGLELAWCIHCGHERTLPRLQQRMLSKHPTQLFGIRVHLPPLEDPGGGGAVENEVALPEPVVQDYVTGRLSDQELIGEARRARGAHLEARDEALVVLGDRVHRPPFDELVDAMDADPVTEAMLDQVLELLDRPLVLEKGSPVELLHRVWPRHGQQALVEVLGQEGQGLFDPNASRDDLERLTRQVSDRASAQRVDRELPSYERVPPPADLADQVARAMIAGGKDAAQQHLNQPPRRAHQAMALALVRATGLPSPSWTIEPREREMADHLEPYARELIQARGEAYHEKLATLLKATGSTADLERQDP